MLVPEARGREEETLRRSSSLNQQKNESGELPSCVVECGSFVPETLRRKPRRLGVKNFLVRLNGLIRL